MSYDYRFQRTTTNRPGARRYYAPPPGAARGNASHHSFFGYWVPLVVTGTLAIGGLAAWIWSERSEHDEDDHPQDKPPRPQTGAGQQYPTQGSQPYPGPPPQEGYGPPPGQSGPPPPPPPGGEASTYYNTTSESREANTQYSSQQQQDGSWYGRMAGAMKRTPSPQQFFDTASKGVTAGVAAAGAALGSIMEGGSDEERDQRRQNGGRSSERRTRTEDRDGFSDHERWSEEAEERQKTSAVEAESERRAKVARNVRDDKSKGRAKRAIAVVVSADVGSFESEGAGYTTEHASILSHLPTEHNSDTTDLFVLIYAPGMKTLPPVNYQLGTGTQQISSTVGSSYSQVSTPAVTPGSELQSMSPRVDAADAPTKQFDALYSQGLALVGNPTQILPFTTPDGYVHILRHLAPQLVYVSDVLSGDDGDNVAQLKGWVGHTILVAGDDGVGGLADTETEDERADDGRKAPKKRWYDESSFVGLGKDVEVVDATRVGDDWARRVSGRE